MRTLLLILSVTVLMVTAACSASPTPYEWELPAGFPEPRVPADNPMTEENVELGRYLFYDTRLSGNETLSCASCHQQSLAFTDGQTQSIGSTGEMHTRNSIGLANTAYNSTLTWANPILDELEEQIVIPMFSEFPVELGLTGYETILLERLAEDEQYQEMFTAAYPDDTDPITLNNTVKALASFVRTIISGNSRYDQYVYQEDETALTKSEQRGMEMFLSEELECHHCHVGFNFSGSTVHSGTTFAEKTFQNNGLYNIDGEGGYPKSDTGLYDFTGNAADMGRFRPVSLRNVALTAPYMHDGSIETLEEVVEMYAAGGRGDGRTNPHKSGFVSGFTITDQQKTDLLNFLNSLTDESLLTDSRYSNPYENK